ncbi:hypothetical protein H1164_08390 [Thermoactinomyces daqus]|uniref:Uncharacterized protein n=1 Tax=Thermoactinomyces daqus TaxID=1329516 RepID=A0A7W1XAC7_9BACL|nr:hypothetical protein [Thermoactinomyces daqus]MBA4542919.1 hypothetical protein [Thermoactinomyces daqus]
MKAKRKKEKKVFYVVRFGAYLILLCNVIISYVHCLQLFMDLVYFPSPLLYHVGVVSLDTVFILSVIVLTESRGRGIPPWFCLIFGLSFTLWSNIRDALKVGNWEGVAVGASTVVALLLIKILLTWMEKNKHLFGIETESGSEQEDEMVSTKKAVVKPSTTLNSEMVGGSQYHNDLSNKTVSGNSLPHETVSDGSLPNEVVGVVSGNGKQTNGSGKTVEETVSGREAVDLPSKEAVDDKEMVRQAMTVETVDEQQNGNDGMVRTVDKTVGGKSGKVVSLPERKANGKKTVGGKTVGNEMVADIGKEKTVDDKLVDGNIGKEKMVEGKMVNDNGKLANGNEKMVGNELVDDEKELAEIIEVAKRYKREHGKIGRVKLQKLTGCTQGQARRALKALEQLEEENREVV